VLYEFGCRNCQHIQEVVFSVKDYDKKVSKKGKLKRAKCEQCGKLTLYRHISVSNAPSILGGPGGYISMERWQREHPEYAKRNEEQLEQKLADRRRKRVMDRINKQTGGDKRDQRDNDYGKGQQEERLRLDD